ncbi:MAG: heat-inducible transcriptional repressor HrcA [Eubacteriales bacterium]
MALSERKLKILQAIITDFINSAEPIGSRTLSKKLGISISPATIRNEMSDLEDMGYLTHPHTSAGRVPSDKAYRLYVNSLMEKYELQEDDKNKITARLSNKFDELDKALANAAEILSELTNLTSFALTPGVDSNRLKYINLIPVDEKNLVMMLVTETGKVSNKIVKTTEPYSKDKIEFLSKFLTVNYKGKKLSDIMATDILESCEKDLTNIGKLVENIMPNFLSTLENMMNVELFLDGMTNIFSIPEYNNLERAKMFLEIINRKKELTEVLLNRDSGVIITIGNENIDQAIQECSLITASYCVDGKCIGKLGVIGPTRMNYGEITSIIEYMTENLSKSFRLTEGEEDE